MSVNHCQSEEPRENLRVLVADRDRSARDTLRDRISSWGFEVRTVEIRQLQEGVQSFAPDVLLIDIEGQEKGAALLQELHAQGIEIPAIFVTEEAELAAAVRSIKFGAYDFLARPINPGHLRLLLSNFAIQLSVSKENQRLRRQLIESGALDSIVGQSFAMRRVMRVIEEAAASAAPVLIVGEPGTGKNLAARTIHKLSQRSSGSYVEFTCAGVPENLLESELWGHARGAFAGADRVREGRLEMADGGTILLDDIAELKLELQAKLVRTLEDRKFRRMGAVNEPEISSDFRLLAASSRNLTEAVHHGRFREDLYSRLSTLTIELPPLRDRLEDIPALVDALIKRSAEAGGKAITGVDNECLEILRLNRWPGNVAQLRSVIERAVTVARQPLLAAPDLPNDIRRAGRKGPLFELRIGESMDEVERELIFKTLDFTNGNKVRAAQILGISLKTLYNRLVRYRGKDREPSNESQRHHDN